MTTLSCARPYFAVDRSRGSEPRRVRGREASLRTPSGLAAKFPLPQLTEHDRPRVRRLFEVDQELRKRLGPKVAEELPDPAGTLVVGQREDVEEHGTGCGTDGVETIAECAFDGLEVHP